MWKPHPGPQTEFLRRGEFEILYGGKAGPGKTDCLIAKALGYVQFPVYRGVLFRRTYDQLEEIIDRALQLYPRAIPGAEYRKDSYRWDFPTGASIRFRHMQHDRDRLNHQGKEYQFIGFDEACQFLQSQYLYLFSRARTTKDWERKGLRPIVRATANPGGVGHAFIQKRFRIGSVQPGKTIFDEFVDPETGEIHVSSRCFIEASLDDNPSIDRADYVQKLANLSDIERQRLLLGIWTAFEGQAFLDLNEDVHGFEFEPQPDWEVFGSFDWGYAKPWSYGLYAVDYDGRIYRFAEHYGAKEEDGEYTDDGLRQSDAEIARAIIDLERSFDAKPRTRIADPAIWSRRPQKGGISGPSPADNFRAEGLHFVKADNDRIPGRQQVHHRLQTDEDGKPWVYIHKRCRAFWQTMPQLREAENNPEDIESKNTPDHVYDEFRYAMKYRPIRPKVKAREDTHSFQAERKRLIAAKQLATRYGISLNQAYARMR